METQEIMEKATKSQLDSFRKLVSVFNVTPDFVTIWYGKLCASFKGVTFEIDPNGCVNP